MNLEIFPHEHFMSRALEQARAAQEIDEVPVGAIIVCDQTIIGAAHNQCQQLRDATAHAEMLAITQAAEAVGDWRLEGCTLYVTLEPCPMCAGAILQSRIPHVVFGADDPKAGAVKSMFQLLSDSRLNHQCAITSGIMQQACGQILTDFFRAKRALGKK
ncbi:MAG: tRNA adenosine(34) deaminase TadA [Planctomycetota bacterium]